MNHKLNQLKASYFRKCRLEHNLKLDAFRSLAHYSPSYISEIELYKKIPDSEVWDQLFSVFHIDLQDDDWIIKHLQRLYQYYHSYYFMDEIGIDDFERNILAHSEYERSPLFYKYWLLLFIYYLYKQDIKSANIYHSLLKGYIDYFDDGDTYAFKIYSGSFYLVKHEASNAMKPLELAKYSNSNFKYLDAILNYNLSLAYFYLGSHVQAYHYLQKAKEMFVEDINIYRLCIAFGLEASIYSEQKQYLKADSCYKEVINRLGQHKDNPIFNITCINYANCLNQQQCYKEALTILELCSSVYKTQEEYIFNRTWAIYKLGYKNECLEYINDRKDYIKDDIYFNQLIRVVGLLNENPSSPKIEKDLTHIYKTLEKDLCKDSKLFILNLLSEYYERKEKPNKQCEILQKMIKL